MSDIVEMRVARDGDRVEMVFIHDDDGEMVVTMAVQFAADLAVVLSECAAAPSGRLQ